MPVPHPSTYLQNICATLRTHWPQNRAINIVCHGHSVPAGYFATPRVDSLNAYPHLLREELAALYPFSVTNVIVSAIGGENSIAGSARFADDVLGHKPDVVTLDYGLNDRWASLAEVETAWRNMTTACVSRGIAVILMTPTFDLSIRNPASSEWRALVERAALIRRLADELNVGLCDSFAAWERSCEAADVAEFLSWSNHPNRRGHQLVALELMKWFRA